MYGWWVLVTRDVIENEKRRIQAEEHLCQKKIKTPLFLQRELVEVRELWFLGHYNLRMLVGLVVQFKNVAGVSEILLGLLFDFVPGFDPVKQLSSFFFIYGVTGFVTLERFVMSSFSFKGSLWGIPGEKTSKIIAANESNSIKNSTTSHNSNTCHTIYTQTFQN